MGVTAVAVDLFRPGLWSSVALVLAGAGVVVATWFVVASQTDPAHVRWWLVFTPVAIAAIPVAIPAQRARTVALVLQAGWCFLAGFSIGYLLLPALVALAVATAKGA